MNELENGHVWQVYFAKVNRNLPLFSTMFGFWLQLHLRAFSQQSMDQGPWTEQRLQTHPRGEEENPHHQVLNNKIQRNISRQFVTFTNLHRQNQTRLPCHPFRWSPFHPYHPFRPYLPSCHPCHPCHLPFHRTERNPFRPFRRWSLESKMKIFKQSREKKTHQGYHRPHLRPCIFSSQLWRSSTWMRTWSTCPTIPPPLWPESFRLLVQSWSILIFPCQLRRKAQFPRHSSCRGWFRQRRTYLHQLWSSHRYNQGQERRWKRCLCAGPTHKWETNCKSRLELIFTGFAFDPPHVDQASRVRCVVNLTPVGNRVWNLI